MATYHLTGVDSIDILPPLTAESLYPDPAFQFTVEVQADADSIHLVKTLISDDKVKQVFDFVGTFEYQYDQDGHISDVSGTITGIKNEYTRESLNNDNQTDGYITGRSALQNIALTAGLKYDIEDLFSGDDTLIGSDEKGGEVLSGYAGSDVIYGNAGNDILEGGEGADKMYGGIGNDEYYVDDKLDEVHENPGEGTDRIQSEIDISLVGMDIENLYVDAHSATGNNLDNKIIAFGGSNIVRGKGGDDKIQSLGGADTLYGGDGADRLVGGKVGDDLYAGRDDDRDILVYDSKQASVVGNFDRIFQFTPKKGHERGSDKIDLSDLHLKWSGVHIVDAGKNIKVLADVHSPFGGDTMIKVMHVDHLHRADFIL